MLVPAVPRRRLPWMQVLLTTSASRRSRPARASCAATAAGSSSGVSRSRQPIPAAARRSAVRVASETDQRQRLAAERRAAARALRDRPVQRDQHAAVAGAHVEQQAGLRRQRLAVEHRPHHLLHRLAEPAAREHLRLAGEQQRPVGVALDDRRVGARRLLVAEERRYLTENSEVADEVAVECRPACGGETLRRDPHEVVVAREPALLGEQRHAALDRLARQRQRVERAPAERPPRDACEAAHRGEPTHRDRDQRAAEVPAEPRGDLGRRRGERRARPGRGADRLDARRRAVAGERGAQRRGIVEQGREAVVRSRVPRPDAALRGERHARVRGAGVRHRGEPLRREELHREVRVGALEIRVAGERVDHERCARGAEPVQRAVALEHGDAAAHRAAAHVRAGLPPGRENRARLVAARHLHATLAARDHRQEALASSALRGGGRP
jgi:hypothetical protein